jgi:hypothetical protein
MAAGRRHVRPGLRVSRGSGATVDLVRTGIVVAVAALAAVSSCSGSSSAPPPSVPAFTSSTPQSTVATEKAVPKTCGGIATLTEVTDILGAAVTGQTLPIVGVPEPKIGRTGRIDCYYGVPEGKLPADAVVTIGFATYSDEAAAKRRMASTVEAEREAGAKATDVQVGSDKGVLLNSTKRTVVAVRGKNTIVVIVHPDLVPEDQAASLVGRLADHALTPRA